jgi:phospholipase/carboxylesterase
MLDTDFIPAADQQSRRLMIVLHGLGDSMEGYRWWPQAMRLPWLNYLLVNAPDEYYGGFAWYDIHNPEKGVRRSHQLLTELLTHLKGKEFVPAQTVMSGFSQGCLMLIELGARLPDKLAGIVGVSGYVMDPDELVSHLGPAALEQRFLLTHGTQDPLIPIEQVRPQIEILRKAGLQINWREFQKAHTIAGEEEMSVIRAFVQDCFA